MLALDPADEIHAGVLITQDGEIIHPQVRAAWEADETATHPAVTDPEEAAS
jgi:hypothetical protein